MKKALILIAMVLFIGLIFYLTEIGPKKEIKANPSTAQNRKQQIPVETVSLHRGSIDRRLHLTGTIISEAMVDVLSKVSGILEKIQVERGDRIKADQIIAMVDSEEKEAQLQETQAALDVLRARWAQMETGARPEEITQSEQLVLQTKASWETSLDNYMRLKNLKERNFISQQRLDEAMLQVTLSEADYRSAKEKLTLLRKGARQEDRDALLAQIRQAEAALRLTQIHLKNTTIRASISGIISKRFLDQGSFVSTTTPIVRIVAMDRIKVLVQVVENELAQLRCGAKAEIYVDAYQKQVFRGGVSCISPTVDPESRMADIEIQVENKDHRLKPGMFARVNLVVQRRNGVLLLSKDSLIKEHGHTRVFVHDNGRALLREVSLGLEGEKYVEVVSGLQEGEEVIVAGQYELKDMMPVRVMRRQKTP
ncbi:MAG: efflux RND transporter periplasmic adaptor subunit [Deltaproteobacteria bacterium]|nr:efflux RND transporter periplasmic adaptor subunit [Deltaproteobacteria bacterium]